MTKQNYLHYKSIGQGIPILCLHGFSEDLTTWHNIVNLFEQHNLLQTFSLHCIDLIGHGKSIKPEKASFYSIENILESIHHTAEKILADMAKQGYIFQKYCLLGYSLGGRIATHYALKYPLELHAVILESASFGIAQPTERLERAQKDKTLATKIATNDIAFFENYWSKLKIFNSQAKLDESTQNTIKNRRLQNNPLALANTLNMTGQGNLPYIRENFLQMTIPTLYICGQYDEKYLDIAHELQNVAEHVAIKVINHAGHNAHTENPEEFFLVLSDFLLQLKVQCSE